DWSADWSPKRRRLSTIRCRCIKLPAVPALLPLTSANDPCEMQAHECNVVRSEPLIGVVEKRLNGLRLEHPEFARGAGFLLDEPAWEQDNRPHGEPSASTLREQIAQPSRLCERLHDDAVIGRP